MAAQDVPCTGRFNAELLREKVRTILYMAAIGGHRALVLGAFGCGYFRNPASVVAATFKEVLERGDFAHAFDVVLFAVPGAGSNPRAFQQHFLSCTVEMLTKRLQKKLEAATVPRSSE